MIEIEKRGPLTKQQFQDFQKFLSKNATLLGKYNQIGIFTTFQKQREQKSDKHFDFSKSVRKFYNSTAKSKAR